MIRHKELKEILDYNPETGIFTWKKDVANNVKTGVTSGTLNSYGYVCITILKKRYLSHRLAWFYIYGEWPNKQIDHINGVRTDNRLCNLRDVSVRENAQNKHVHRKGKLLGATQDKRTGKWWAQIQVNGKHKFLGSYFSELEASQAYLTSCRDNGVQI